jgi:hypothetical protein
VALIGAALSFPALAGNGGKLRTPVVWSTPPTCMLEVDRRVDPVVHFEYTVPLDDLRPPGATDEVDDSRTHQFFAFCRQHSPAEFLPNWISDADVTAAMLKNLVSDGSADEAREILDTAPRWSDCFVRIIADDARVPITEGQAEMGVEWDTSGLTAGPWVVEGYTWEPENNLWSPRRGVVRVFDSDDPADNPPAAALLLDDSQDVIIPEQPFPLTLCTRVTPGSTLTAEYASFPPDDAWVAFAEDVPVEPDDQTIEFLAPETIWGHDAVAFRVTVRDAMGRETVAYGSGEPRAVAAQPDDTCDANDSFAAGEACLGETGPNADGSDEPGRGCECAVADPGAPLNGGLLLCCVGALRRTPRSRRRALGSASATCT